MNKFEIIQPSVLLAPYVYQYWILKLDGVSESFQRLIPFGCVGITFNRAVPVYSIFEQSFLPESYLSGQSTNYLDLRYSGSLNFITIVFKPAGVMKFLETPMNEFTDRYISITDLRESGFVDLDNRLMDTIDDNLCISLIEDFLKRKASRFDQYNYKRLQAVINSVHCGNYQVNSLAEVACLSTKQFNRIFTANIGLSPKNYARIVRVHKVLFLWRSQSRLSLPQLSFQYGYYDKSHLIKDVKQLSGYTPSEYISFQSDDKSRSLFHSAFIDL